MLDVRIGGLRSHHSIKTQDQKKPADLRVSLQSYNPECSGFLHLYVAHSRGVVRAHRRGADRVADRLQSGQNGTEPAQRHRRRVTGGDAELVRRRRRGGGLVSDRWRMKE